MYAELILDGHKYKSVATAEQSQEVAFKTFYDNWNSLNKFQLELENGGMLLIGKDAIARSILIVYP